MLRSLLFSALVSSFIAPSLAQDGSLSGPTSSSASRGYSCDPSKCKLPTCACASTSIPGGIPADQTPQFVVVTADDAVQSTTLAAVNSLLAQRKNPNGCSPKMTYYTSIQYTNFSLVTDWFVAGNEIGDHTMTHPELGGADEINGNLIALNALAGIPFSSIRGFRAPFLNYSAEMLTTLHASGFEYDSSASASIPVTDNDTDAFWPYTLDNGLANDCLSFEGICKGKPALPGMWEIPMYAIFGKDAADIHLMDPWLDGTPDDVLSWLKKTFADHYNANRQPFGLYTHPIHIAKGVPGQKDPSAMVNAINAFLDFAQQQTNTWIVSSEQLLDWVKAPVPASQLNTIPSFQCGVAVVNEKICNGQPDNEAGLLSHCAFNDFPFYTCYGCPANQPSPSDPNPSQVVVSGSTRARLPPTCDTVWWDPIGAKCLCQNGTSCQFTDSTRPIGPNGANLTSGNTSANSQTTSNPYVPFGGSSGAPVSYSISKGVVTALVIGAVGVVGGMISVLA